MATQRQKKLAKAIVENAVAEKPKNAKELVLSSGYDINTATRQVPAVFEQKGVVEELAKLGFNESNAKRVVGQILNTGEDPNRLKAADMIFKVNGSYAPEKNINVNVQVMDDQAISDLAIRLNKEMTNEVYEGNGEPSNGEVSGTVAQEVRHEDGERSPA
jgi:hypothetical protein